MEQFKNYFPYQTLDEFIEYFKDKTVIDLNCGDENIMIYIKEILNCKEIFGINSDNKLNKNLKDYGINIYNGNFFEIDFTGYNTYFLWIEDYRCEINLINFLNKINKKCDIIILYKLNHLKASDLINFKKKILSNLIKYFGQTIPQYKINQIALYEVKKLENIFLQKNYQNKNKFEKFNDFFKKTKYNFQKKIEFKSHLYIFSIVSIKGKKLLQSYTIKPPLNETEEMKRERLRLQARIKIKAKQEARKRFEKIKLEARKRFEKIKKGETLTEDEVKFFIEFDPE